MEVGGDRKPEGRLRVHRVREDVSRRDGWSAHHRQGSGDPTGISGMRRSKDLERIALRLSLDGPRSTRRGRAHHQGIERRGACFIRDLPDLPRLRKQHDPVPAGLQRRQPPRGSAGRRCIEQSGPDDDLQVAGQHRRSIAARLRPEGGQKRC